MNGKIFKSEFQRNDQNLKPNKLELREDVAKGSNKCEDEGRRDVTVTKSTRFSIKVAEIREVKHRGEKASCDLHKRTSAWMCTHAWNIHTNTHN